MKHPRSSMRFLEPYWEEAWRLKDQGFPYERAVRTFNEFHKQAFTYFVDSASQGLKWILDAYKPKRVFLPAYTCQSVVEVVTAAKIPIEFVPLQKLGWNWDVNATVWGEGLALVTHMFGIPADFPPVLPGLVVVEDCAHAFGASKVDKKGIRTSLGQKGVASIFSFGDDKPLNMNGGGVLLFKEPFVEKYVHEPEIADETAVLERFLEKMDSLTPRYYEKADRNHLHGLLTGWSKFKMNLFSGLPHGVYNMQRDKLSAAYAKAMPVPNFGGRTFFPVDVGRDIVDAVDEGLCDIGYQATTGYTLFEGSLQTACRVNGTIGLPLDYGLSKADVLRIAKFVTEFK